jgi:hypothetical protein
MPAPWVGGAGNKPLPATVAPPKPLGTTQGTGVERPSNEIPTLNPDGSTSYSPGADTGMASNGANPYSGATSQDQQNMDNANSALNALPGQINQAFAGFQQQLQALYPSFQNPMGLGSGVPYGQQPQSQPDPSLSSHGFNPWSLRGEALSR